MTWTRDRDVARHEAAHAVVMMATCSPVKLVTVEPDGDSLGRAQVDLAAVNGPPVDAMPTAWHHVFALLIAAAHSVAGPVADDISGRRSDRREGDDAIDVIESITGVPGFAWAFTLWEAVRVYLRANWSTVERIADALLERGTLRDADLRALVGEVPRLELNPVLRSIEHHVRARAVATRQEA